MGACDGSRPSEWWVVRKRAPTVAVASERLAVILRRAGWCEVERTRGVQLGLKEGGVARLYASREQSDNNTQIPGGSTAGEKSESRSRYVVWRVGEEPV